MATDTDRRRIKALEIMERVKRLDTERQARATGEIRARMDRLDSEKQALLQRLSGESHIEGLEGAPYLGRFIHSIRSELDRISHEAAKLAPELARAEDRLRIALSEQKTYEILRFTRLTEARKQDAKREAAAQDELSLLRWKR
ncbi:flagellar export protein FliJ [Salipiger sp. P9]|uniref:flagellar export protein FliJ n=1 Tax=Salipiger pentaromativorans TaxID=2943193 RepID=UPI002157D81D|nr:flagellar export protein FliJ [Salipiger pentaromativorans]MCR8550568.1 flagellar export protein FliJ [Salipiger pentaromativorans]